MVLPLWPYLASCSLTCVCSSDMELLWPWECSDKEASSLPRSWWIWKRGKHTLLCDARAYCGAGSMIWPFILLRFLLSRDDWTTAPLLWPVKTVTHFLCIFNYLYGTCLTTAPQLMCCHYNDWPPCATNRAECTLNHCECVCVCVKGSCGCLLDLVKPWRACCMCLLYL